MTQPEQVQLSVQEQISGLDNELREGPHRKALVIGGEIFVNDQGVLPGLYEISVYIRPGEIGEVEPNLEQLAILADGSTKKLLRSDCPMAILAFHVESGHRNAGLYFVTDREVLKQRVIYRSKEFDEVDDDEARRILGWAAEIIARKQ
ncbi:MAG TPA: hypothetical protein VLG47_07790 [Candidatus Saccharimonadales bacterium]|nr:hypothetical protein [Candidatus Saccharimonadales bacterium]